MTVRDVRRGVNGARRSAAGSSSRVVVVTAEEIPAWVGDWCRREGREVRVHRSCPDLGHPEGPSDAELVRAVARLTGEVVLVIRPDVATESPRCVAAAVRDVDRETAVLAHAGQIAADAGASVTLIHAVPRSFGERSVGLGIAVERGRRTITRAARRLAADAPGVPVAGGVVRAHPHEAVGEALHADLLVLGGPLPARGEPGLVIRSALQHAPCPVLLVPRAG